LRNRGHILIIASLCVWSTWGLAVRWLAAPAVVLTFYNGLFSMVFQAGWLYRDSKRENLRPGRDILALVLLGFCGLVNVLSYFYALKTASIATAVLTHYTAPVFVAFIAPYALDERMSRSTAAALTVSAAGLGLVVAPDISAGGAGLWGAAAGTLSGLAYAFIIIFSRALTGRNNPLKLAFVQGVVTTVCLAPFVVGTAAASLSLVQAAGLIVVGVLHSTVAIVVYLHGIRTVTAQEAGVLGYLEPALGIMLAYLFLSEPPRMLTVAGGLLIIAAGAMVVYKGSRSSPSPPVPLSREARGSKS